MRKDKSRTLNSRKVPGKPKDEMLADIAVSGIASNAMTLVTFSRGSFGELSLTDRALAIREVTGAVNRGDLTAAEKALNAQALARNAVFVELARRAALNVGTHLPATETSMRLALKAQSQSRATIETLAEIKNPPVVFARQANFANGPQQVNNGAAGSRTPETQTAPTELLEELTHERTQLDTGAMPATAGEDSRLVPVEALDRAAQS